MKYKTGDLLLISHGEYSDYDVRAIVRVVKDLDSREVTLSYQKEIKDDWFDDHAFLAYLVKQGCVEDVDYQEWHTGGYGRIEIPEVAK